MSYLVLDERRFMSIIGMAVKMLTAMFNPL